MRHALTVAVSALVGLVLVACTPGEEAAEPPEPPVAVPDADSAGPLGAEVAVLLPSRGVFAATAELRLAEDLGALTADTLDGISDLRLHTPESTTFARDLARTFGERGFDVVCALGPEALSATQEASELHRATRYCAVPADRDEPVAGLAALEPTDPGEVTRVEVRTEELGHAVGIAARRRAGDAPVGLLVEGDAAGSRFLAGLEAGLDGVEVIEPGGVDDDLDDAALGEARARSLLDEDVEVVVLDGGPGAAAALEVLAGETALIGPASLLDGHAAADDVAVAWQVRWADVLAAVLTALVGDEPGQGSFGFGDGVFAWHPGPASSAAVGAAVADAVAAIAEGRRDPLAPPPAAELVPVVPVEPDPDDAADPDDEPDDADDDADDDGDGGDLADDGGDAP